MKTHRVKDRRTPEGAVTRWLRQHGIRAGLCTTAPDALFRALAARLPAFAVIDLRHRERDHGWVIRDLRRRYPDVELLVLAARSRPSASPKPRSAIDRLTPREREVLDHIGNGADNLKLAATLGICERTVKAHVSSIFRKLGAENRVELALVARGLPVSI